MKIKLSLLLLSAAFVGAASASWVDPERCVRVCIESRQVCIAAGSSVSYCDNYYHRCLAGCGGLL